MILRPDVIMVSCEYGFMFWFTTLFGSLISVWDVLDMVKYTWRLWVINKESITSNKGSEHPMWSYRTMILEVFGQNRMIIRKRFLMYHQLNHHLLIEIHNDKWLGLTYFHAYSSSGMLFDWKIELYENLPLKGILIIFY